MSPLRTERLQRHWSQRELAERVDATIATVKRWERGISVPGPYFRLKLTALFGKSEEELGLKEAPSSLSASSPASEATGEEQAQALPVSSVISPLWTVPDLRNPHFTGRDELFRRLEGQLAFGDWGDGITARRAALTQAQALTGLGGMGKTQVAIEFAYRMREQGVYTHTLWVNASSEEAIITSFISCATLLPTRANTNNTDQQQLVNEVKRWLENCSDRWLLIFDNADDLSLVQSYFPRYGNGSILLTTRAHAVGSVATAIEVEKLSFTEAIHLLQRRAQRLKQASMDDEMHAKKQLVENLDYFPLALEQAGAYIEETGCSFEEYLYLYHAHRSTLLARRGAQAVNYPDSVATTWSLSFQQVEHANPAATQLLRLCAFLAPDHIPEELVIKGATCWPPVLEQAVTNPLTYNQVLQALLRFSLIKRLTGDQSLRIHRLVQVVQMNMIAPDEQYQWADRVVRVVNELFPQQSEEDASSWPKCQRYLEQVQACAILIEQHQVGLTEAADVLNRAGRYLRRHASYPLAEAFYKQALHLREQILGANHLETASSLYNLGYLYLDQGKLDQAEPYLQQALKIREMQLGVSHPEIAETLHCLGALYDEQGKYDQAEAYYNQALKISEKELGTSHVKTAGIRNSLGFLYCLQGKYDQAETYLRQALKIREEQLGVHNTKTAGILNNLGLLYWEQGKYGQSEVYYLQALAIFEELFGAFHPVTAHIMSNLAEVYRDQHNYEQSEQLFARSVAILEHKWTANHPDLAWTLHGFARLYEVWGMLHEAVPLYQRALSIREQVYGPDHLKTSETRECLQRVLYLLEHEGKEVQQNARYM